MKPILLIIVGAFAPTAAVAAQASASSTLVPIEMAPISIPSADTPTTPFAKQLANVCNGLTGQNVASIFTPPPAASSPPAPVAPSAPPPPPPFQIALLDANNPTQTKTALSGLMLTCKTIIAGNALTDNDLKNLAEFRSNPETTVLTINAVAKSIVVTPQSNVGAAAISSGSLESSVINGLAAFIYDRAKEESVVYLRQQLDAKLCTGTPKLFFTATCVALASTDPSVPLGAMGSYLIAASRRDLRAMPDRLLAYELHDLKGQVEGAPAREVLFGARLGLAYYTTVASGRAPLDVARSMHAITAPDDIGTVAGYDTDVLKATQVASELVDSVTAQQGWTDLTSAKPSDLTVRYYAIAILFSLRDEYAKDKSPMGQWNAATVIEEIPVVARLVCDMAALETRIETAKTQRAASGASSSASGSFVSSSATSGGSTLTQRDFMLATTQTLERTLDDGVAVAIAFHASPAGTPLPANIATRIKTVEAVLDLGEQIVGGASPSDVLILADDLVDNLNASITGADGKQPTRGLSDLQQLVALVSQIAGAKSADEVANILDTAAAPATSYADKYKHTMITIGAMAGASLGRERLQVDGTWGWLSGAVAPVGFTLSTPLCSHAHVGIMLSVIDLGALVSARFSQDVNSTQTTSGGQTTMTTTTVQTTPQLKVENVFAPGVFANLGLFGSPFVLSFGSRIVPAGREVSTTTAAGTTTSTAPAIQIVGALSVDVPIFVF